MSGKAADFHFDGEKDKPAHKGQAEAENAIERMYNAVNFDRDAARSKANNPEIADNAQAKPDALLGDSASFLSQNLSQKPTLNYYEGKLTAGAGAAAGDGLKGLFNVDRLNNMFSSNNDAVNPYKSTRVDGLNSKDDPLPSQFQVPNFVPKNLLG